MTDKASLFIGSRTSNSRRCSGHQSTQRLPRPLWLHLLTLIKKDTARYSPFARSPQGLLAWRTSKRLINDQEATSRQDTGGLALSLTPGQSIVEMSHFKDKMKMVFTVKEVKLLSFPSGAKEAHSRSLLPCSAYQKLPKCPKDVKKMEEGMHFEWIFSRKLLPVGDTYVFLHFGSVLLSQHSASGGLSFIRYGYLSSVNQILQHTSTPLSKTKCLGWFISSQWFPPIAFWNYSLQ